MHGGACPTFLLFLPNLFFWGCSQTKAGQINVNFGDFLNIHYFSTIIYGGRLKKIQNLVHIVLNDP